MKRDPKIVFGEWAEIGRDEGMAIGHQSSVNQMLSLALKGRRKFSFIDAGCGNGWVVRQVAEHPECISAAGVDAAQQMIEKAKACDSKNSYVCADLERWSPNSLVDVVHSMEVVYYLDNPASFFQNIYKKWLQKNAAHEDSSVIGRIRDMELQKIPSNQITRHRLPTLLLRTFHGSESFSTHGTRRELPTSLSLSI